MAALRVANRTARPLHDIARFRQAAVKTATAARFATSTRPVSKPRLWDAQPQCRQNPWTAPTRSRTAPYRCQSSNASPAPTFYTDEDPGRTALYDLHVRHGGKMVPFGGYSMPLQYTDQTIGESHAWTREHCSIFDVGHMVQYHVEGPGAEAFLESVTPSGLADLPASQSTYSVLLHPTTGGICDDCIITRLENGPQHLFYLVTNAGNRQKDFEFLSAALTQWDEALNPPVQLRHLEADGQPFGLIALQGPQAAEVLSEALAPTCKVDISKWWFGGARHITLALAGGAGESRPIVAARAGYTGEDGFELSVHPAQTAAVAERLLSLGGEHRVRLAGLAPRDSLRLEAGMCLYGHDIDDSTTPAEAGLAWVVNKARRDPKAAGFNGAERILPQLVPASKGGAGVERRRVGLVVEGSPAREGAEVVDESGAHVGNVTSGCPSPTLKKNIAMAYVRDGLHKSGTELHVVVRGRKRKAIVTKMPFVPSNYVKGG